MAQTRNVEVTVQVQLSEEFKRMIAARDIDLHEWLRGVGFHPADTEAKQLGHEAARHLVALLGSHLHAILPPGRDKSLVFTALEDVLMRSNRALALGGGPQEATDVDFLREVIEDARGITEQLGVGLVEDERIDEYKAEQLNRGHFKDGAVESAADLADRLVPTREEPGYSSSTTSSVGDPYHLEIRSQDFGDGRNSVAIATVCSDPAKVREVCARVAAGEQDDIPGGFKGFVFTAKSPDHLSAVLHELAEAGQHAFGTPQMPL